MKIKRAKLRCLLKSFFFVFGIIYLSYSVRGLIKGAFGEHFSLVHNVVLLAIYLISLAFLRGFKRNFNFLGLLLVWSFVVYAFVSIIWTSSVRETVGAVVGIIGLFAFAAGLVNFYGRNLPNLLVSCIYIYSLILFPFFILGMSFVSYGLTAEDIAYRGYGTVQNTFAGLAGHKNLIGNLTGIAVVMCYCLYRENRMRGYLFKLLFLSLVLISSQSTTSIASAAVAITVFELALWGGRKPLKLRFYLILLSAFSFLVFTISFYFWSDILKLMGENETLSSRTRLWSMVISVGLDNFWFGNGFGAFWADGSTAVLDSTRIFSGKIFQQAHNGYLELFAQGGALGLIIGTVLCIYAFLNTYSLGKLEYRSFSLWIGLVFILINNVAEANMFVPNYLFLSLLLVCCIITKDSLSQN